MKPNDESSVRRTASQNGGYRRDYPPVVPYQSCSQIKVITLRRKGSNTPLGFSIRGGWEHGTGVFVSEVQPGSIAHRQGLRVGDQIVRINGFSIHRAIHMEVLSLLKTCPGLVLKVRRVGILPVKERRRDPVTWKVVESSNTLSPKPSRENSRLSECAPENCIIAKIKFSVPGSTSLGCSIAKGPPELPGIFMCTVKEGGLADEAGLEVGDQIMEMNGTNFYDIKLADAVALMKSCKDIKLTVKKRAGVCLFSDQSASQDQNYHNHNHHHPPPPPPMLMNGTLDSKNGNMAALNSDTIQRRQCGMLKNHDFSGSSSSKSEEESSFRSSAGSSDSEKDYSISEESGIHSLKPRQNGCANGWHKKSASVATTNSAGISSSSCSSSDEAAGAIRYEDKWLEEEKRRLEEEQRKLMLEQQRIEEEKRRLLQLQGKTSSTLSSSSATPEDAPRCGFLEELQKVAAKMSIKDDRASIDRLLLERRSNDNRRDDSTLKRGDGCRTLCQEDVAKKRQHEMLMEEFREAHRKMFGQQSLDDESGNIQNGTLTRAAPKSCRSPSPPPTLPKSSIKSKITVNGQTVQSQTLPRPDKNTVDSTATSSTSSATNGQHHVNFRITFETKNNSEPSMNGRSSNGNSAKGALVQVKPWTTRL